MRTYSFIILGLALLVGCTEYNVSVNDRVVYTPEPLFSDYQLADDNLAGCVRQTIKDRKITRAGGLTRLQCTHAGIASLEGLGRFHSLKQLDLRHNKLTGLTALNKLGQLEVVLLKDNQLTDVAPLLKLLKLVELDVSGNPQAPCSDIEQAARAVRDNGGMAILPEHCQ